MDLWENEVLIIFHSSNNLDELNMEKEYVLKKVEELYERRRNEIEGGKHGAGRKNS